MSLVNLLPEDYITHQRQKRANLMCLLLFITVMAGLAGAGVVSERKHQRTREVCERVDKSYEDAGKLIEQMHEQDATRHSMLQKATLTAALLERVPRSYLLATITKALPKDASLTEFRLRTRLAKSPGTSRKKKSKFDKIAAAKKKSAKKTPRKVKVEIVVTGLAGTNVEVGRFIATMERCPQIESVNFIFSQEKKIEETVMREFEVILHLKDNANVQDQPAAKATSNTNAGGTNKRES